MEPVTSRSACSFCGGTEHTLVATSYVGICDECVGLCVDLLAEIFPANGESVIASQRPINEIEANVARAIEYGVRNPVAPRPDPFYCSFCGKPRHEVAKLIAGPRVFICEGCVGLAAAALHRDQTSSSE